MGIVHCTAILAAISLSWLPTSCSKTPAQAATAPVKVAVNPNEKDFGEVTLTNHYETCLAVNSAKSCLITPRLLDHKNVQLTVSLQSKGTDGAADSISVMRVVTQQGKPFEVAIGDMDLTLTPKVTE